MALLFSVVVSKPEHPLQAKRCLREIKLLKMLDRENVIELFQATALNRQIQTERVSAHGSGLQWCWYLYTVYNFEASHQWVIDGDQKKSKPLKSTYFLGMNIQKSDRSFWGDQKGRFAQVLEPPCTVFNEARFHHGGVGNFEMGLSENDRKTMEHPHDLLVHHHFPHQSDSIVVTLCRDCS